MKHLLLRLFTLLALLGTTGLFAQDAGIQFAHGSFQEVLGQAKAQKKILFVDAYTTWCGPCKWMSANTFPDPKVGEFFNANFVSYKLDMEKGEGPDIAKKYNVMAYPTLLFLASNGELIDVAVGALDGKKFLELGEKVIKGGYETLSSKRAKFDQGVRDRDFLYEYLVALSEAGQDGGDVLEAYKEGMNGAALLEEKNWEIFARYFTKTESDQFKYVESNLEQFKTKFGAERVIRKVATNYLNAAYYSMQTDDMATYESIMKKVRGYNDPWALSMVENIELTRYQKQDDWKGYVKQAELMAKEYGRSDAMSLNEFAWNVYEGTTNEKLLKKALAWAESSVEQQPEYANLDTQAMILYALGRKAEAIEAGHAAIEAAKATGEDYSETEKAMNSWK